MVKFTVDYYKTEHVIGGVQSFFDEFKKIYPDFRTISYVDALYSIAGGYTKPQDFNQFELETSGIIQEYIEKYEKLFPLDVIVKNSIVGTFEKHRTPMICVVQDNNLLGPQKLYRHGFYNYYSMNLYSHIFPFLQESTIRNSEIVVSTSEHVKECYDRRYGIESEIIPNGIDTKIFRPMPGKEELREKHGIPKGMKVGISVTSFSQIKGWHILQRIINDYKDIFWIVVFKHKSQQPRLKNVKLFNQVPREQLPELYNCLPTNEKIICKSSIKNIEDIEVGDVVLTHRGEYRNVKKLFKRNYDGEIIKITPFNLALPVKMTPEHPIFAVDSEKCKDDKRIICKPRNACSESKCETKKHYESYEPKWIKAKDITKNHVLCYPIITDEIDVKNIDITDIIDIKKYKIIDNFVISNRKLNLRVPKIIDINEDFMRFCGYFIAEGSSIESSGRVSLCFNINETEFIEDVKYLVKRIFNLDVKEDIQKDKNRISLYFNFRPIADLLRRLFGCGAKNKIIPDWFLKLPKKKQKHLIMGLYRGDGSYSPKLQIQYSTTSEFLCHQIKSMLLRFGTIPSISLIPPSFKSKITRYSINVGGKSLEILSDLLDKKHKAVGNKRFHNHSWIHNNYLYVPVRKIERDNYNGYVYNFEVEIDNSYVSHSASLHNCADFFILPSAMETCNLAGLEALSCGIPTVLSNCGYFWNRDLEKGFEFMDTGIRVEDWKYETYRGALDAFLGGGHRFRVKGFIERNRLDMGSWRAAWKRAIEKVI